MGSRWGDLDSEVVGGDRLPMGLETTQFYWSEVLK